MKRRKFVRLILLVILIGLSSCIERYDPGASGDDFVPKLAIDGIINNENEIQEIIISQSSSPENPEFSPLSGCVIQVGDSNGHTFPFFEVVNNTGHYQGRISRSNFVAGTGFRLEISTPEGKQYSSKSEELRPCPAVGPVYYELKSNPTTDPNVMEDGLQFYLDFTTEKPIYWDEK